MNGMGRLALGGAWAHRGSLAGTALALAVAAALLAVSGVLIQTGLSGGTATGMLTALAGSFSGTVVMATLMVVASTVALALRGRQEDFALLRAVGATRRQVRTLVAVEIMALALLATPVGALAGVAASGLLDPLLITAGLLPPGGGVVLGALPVLAALLVLLPVAGLSAMVATRETLRSSPTQAVRRRGIESGPVGRPRIVTGIVVASAGLASAFSPLFVPGTLGAASAGISAFLLIGAAALLGPLLFTSVLGRVPDPAGAASQVALGNLRGSHAFSPAPSSRWRSCWPPVRCRHHWIARCWRPLVPSSPKVWPDTWSSLRTRPRTHFARCRVSRASPRCGPSPPRC